MLKMKKLFLLSALILWLSVSLSAQKTAVIDINYILENLDSYKKAQTQLDQLAAQWRQEIAVEQDKIKSLYNRYQAEQVLLSEEMKRQREDEITNKEKSIMEMQREKFGPEGSLFKKRQELVKPIQDKVYGAVEEYATARGLEIVFDTGGAIIYVKSDLDKSEDILKKLKQ